MAHSSSANAWMGTKLIELSGGAAHGKRLTVPAATTETTVSVPNVDGGYGPAVYLPSGMFTDDGAELWSEKDQATPWSNSAPAPLI